MVKLFYVNYYISHDFDHFELYEKTITNEKYIRYPKGPLLTKHQSLPDELEKENKIKIKEEVRMYFGFRYASITEPDTSLLNENELKTIDSVINRLSDKTASEISDYSHKRHALACCRGI